MSIPLTIVKKGSDISFKIQTFYQNGITPFSLDDLEEIIVTVYTYAGDLKKFSKTDRTPGYTQLIRIDENLYQGIINNTISATMNVGIMRLEYKYLLTNGDFSDGYEDIQGGADIYELIESITSTETIS